MDKLQWFKFSHIDWMMGKIQRCPENTQARFLRLCCLYWNKECILSHEDAEIEIDKEHLDILINKKIVLTDEAYIGISFLDEQMDNILETSRKNSKAGKISAEKRKTKREQALNDRSTTVQRKPTDKIREDKDKDKIKIREAEFKNSLHPFLEEYGKDMLNDFYLYWTEKKPRGKKMRFEMEKVFDISRRLTTWNKRQRNFTSTKDKPNTLENKYKHLLDGNYDDLPEWK